MIYGISINNKHSFRDFHALLARRSFEYPEELQVTASVPYSNIEYDFTVLYGSQVLMRRDVIFRFKFVNPNQTVNDEDIAAFVEFLYSLSGDVDIYEDDHLRYHWRGKRTTVKNIEDTVGHEYGAHMVEVTFHCLPKRISNLGVAFDVDETKFPDIDGDGSVTAVDAQYILTAAANIGAGEPSGLPVDPEVPGRTLEEQEIRADADRNGEINASDAMLVNMFAAEVGAGHYADTPAGWAKFLNDSFGLDTEVI